MSQDMHRPFSYQDLGAGVVKEIRRVDYGTVKLEGVTMAELAVGDRFLPRVFVDSGAGVQESNFREVVSHEPRANGDIEVTYRRYTGFRADRTYLPEDRVYRVVV